LSSEENRAKGDRTEMTIEEFYQMIDIKNKKEKNG